MKEGAIMISTKLLPFLFSFFEVCCVCGDI